MAVSTEDRAAISEAVQHYIDGVRDGDAAKLRQAFHEDARMFGSLAGRRIDVPIAELFAMADGHPAKVDDSFAARIVSVDQVGDAAAAVVEEEGYWGSVSFTDFFTLSRFGDDWRIVNKTFAHTGGEPPAT